jgi:hypothetical protein
MCGGIAENLKICAAGEVLYVPLHIDECVYEEELPHITALIYWML